MANNKVVKLGFSIHLNSRSICVSKMYTKLDNVAYEFWITTVTLDIIQFSALAPNSKA